MECSQDLSMKQEKGKSVRMTLWSGFWQNSNTQRDILTIIPSQQSKSQVINSLSSLVSRAQRTKKEHYKNEAISWPPESPDSPRPGARIALMTEFASHLTSTSMVPWTHHPYSLLVNHHPRKWSEKLFFSIL